MALRPSTSPALEADPNRVVRLVRRPTGAGSLLRGRVSRRRAAGRIVLVWVLAYLSLRTASPISAAAGQATFVAVVWAAVGQRVAQAFGAMELAFGTTAVAVMTSTAGLLVVSAVSFLVPGLGIRRMPLVLIALLTGIGNSVWDAVVRHAAPVQRRVLVVGGAEPTERLLSDLAGETSAEFQIVAVVDDAVRASIRREVPDGGSLEHLPEAIRRFSPDLVVVAVATGRPRVFGYLLEVADAGFQVVGLPELYEFTFGRLPVRDLTSAWFMSVLHAYQRPSNRLARRSFDIVVALVGVLITLPLLPLIVVLVKRTRGPLLYRQQRLGEHGRVFTMLKFRSMRVDAETAGEARWAAENDPRVIPGGRWLRLLRLDELPQLWNVLRGEMSIVGPRPERPEFVEILQAEVPFWTQRHLLKPGITGWAQIRAGYAADTLGAAEKLSYDLWYLRHRSVVLDASICLKTLPRMALSRGAR